MSYINTVSQNGNRATRLNDAEPNEYRSRGRDKLSARYNGSNNLDELRQALRSSISALAESLLGAPNKPLSNRRELRWGSKGSIRVIIFGGKAGAWADFEAGERGDPIKLIQHVRRCDFKEAVAWGAGWAGIDAASMHIRRPMQNAKHAWPSSNDNAQRRKRDQADRRKRVHKARYQPAGPSRSKKTVSQTNI